MISKRAIDYIKRIDIVEGLSYYLDLKKKGVNYICLCPFHTDKTPSFTVSPRLQKYKCFGCYSSGDIIDFVMKNEHVSFRTACEILSKRYSIDLEKNDSSVYISIKEKELLFMDKVILKIAEESRRLSDEDKKRVIEAKKRISRLNNFLKSKT